MLVLGACSDGEAGDPPRRCGPGTEAVDGVCIVSEGGSAGSPDQPMGGEPASGGNNVGGVNTQGGAAPAAGAGSGDSSGGNGANAGAGGDDAGETPVRPPTRWLAFSNASGAYVYDLGQYPAQTGLTQLSAQFGPVAWSPDGNWLAYPGPQNYWHAIEMSGPTMGVANLLVANVLPSSSILDSARFSWSGDSRSAATIAGKTLTVFDPTKAAPTLHQVTTTLSSYRWAPVGKWLLYDDANGRHLVEVDGGVPGTPVDVDSSAPVWSPTGAALLWTRAGFVYFTTLNGSVATTVPITSGNESPSTLSFNHDGSKLAYQEAGTGISITQLSPTVGQPVHPHEQLPSGTTASAPLWSPQGGWLLFKTIAGEVQSWKVCDTSGATLAAPLSVDAAGVDYFSWSPNSAPQLYGWGKASGALVTFDPAAATPTVVPLLSGSDFSGLAVSPTGAVLAYRSLHALHLLDAHVPQVAATEIRIDSGYDEVGPWQWSNDGNFIAVADRLVSSNAWEQVLIRVDGTSASTPLRLGGRSSQVQVGFAFQP
jgi:Tol biopolymer transport system component